MTINLVPNWRRAWRWFSMWAAAAVVVISVVRETAQHLVDTVPELDWIAHAHWYPPAMLILGALVAVLRLVHQPVDEPSPDPAVPVAPPNPADALNAAISLGTENMSPLFQSVFSRIPQLVIDAEAAFKGTQGSGADKAATVTSIVAAALPAGSSDGMAKAQAIMQMAVAFFNAVHPMFQKPGASTITQAFQPMPPTQ